MPPPSASLSQRRSRMQLVLDDGAAFQGRAFGALRPVAGEVVFNTGMTGYIETLTDPSYAGQILTLTYPLIGNYGVPPSRARGNPALQGPYESDRIQPQGLIVQHYVDDFSHHAARRSLAAWLAAERIPAATGIDTRRLTRHLRSAGTRRGWLFPEELGLEEAKAEASAVDMQREVFTRVTLPEPIRYDGGELTVLLIDVGAKDNIVRSLRERGARVLRVPWHLSLADYAADADGIVIGNGPGDPGDLPDLVDALRGLLQNSQRPIFGICLGSQLLALAAGARTYKLPYGHRGVNQPVQDLLTRRCYVTSQNHGYAVDDATLPAEWEPWFVNINDGTNEGIRCRTRPFYSVQFHPEASPGPRDTGFLFDEFLRLVGATRR